MSQSAVVPRTGVSSATGKFTSYACTWTSVRVEEDFKLSWRETDGDCSQLWTYSHAVTYYDSLCESEASVVTLSAIISTTSAAAVNAFY